MVMRSRVLLVVVLSILGATFVQTAFAATSNLRWGVSVGDRMSFSFDAYARSPQGELRDEVHEGVIMEVDALPTLPADAE